MLHPIRRLVIADDSREMRWLIRAAIGAEFGEVVEVGDGRELLWTLLRDRFTSDAPSVVVSDLFMPIYDGLQVLEACGELAQTQMILITAFPSETVKRNAEAIGVPLLAKPFTVAELRRTLAAVTGGRH